MIITRMLSIFAELVLGFKNQQAENSNADLYQELINIVGGEEELSKRDESRNSCRFWATLARTSRS